MTRRRTGWIAGLAAVVLAATGLAIGIPSASAATLQTNTWYVLVGSHSGLVLGIEGASANDGAGLVQQTRTNANHQQFRFVDAGGGRYRIQTRHSGKALDVYEWNAGNGAEIRQWTDLNGTNQQWRVQESGGYATLINRHSGKALDVWERSTTAGGRISQYTPNGGANQQWQLVRADDGGPGPGPGACGSGTPHATVTGSTGSYTARNGSNTVYTGGDYRAAVQSAVNSLTPGRTTQQRVSVMASGSIGNAAITLPSHTSFEVCGTMNVGNAGGRGAVEAVNGTNVSIPHLTMTGSPYFGMRFYGMNGLHLGRITLNLNGGLGIRFERDQPGSSNVTMDHITVTGAGSHGVETWNVDGLRIGTVVARDVAYAGLLLNNTRNAQIGTVDGENVATGTGYATFRTANTNGRLAGGSYSTNITVDRVISRGGGRGVFCVSQSGGLLIRSVDLAGNGNNAILLENCYNVTIAGGTVNGGGEVRLAARSEFANNRDISITLTVNNTSVRESPCGTNITWNISGNAGRNIC
jgi:hypothetical protein